MRTINFRLLLDDPAWTPIGQAAVRTILTHTRADIEALWQRGHPGEARPYPDWFLPRAGGGDFQTDIFVADVWTHAESEAVLAVLLEALTRIDQVWLRLHRDSPHPLRAGVRYIREVGTEEWLAIPEILREGGGDCEDGSSWLSAWRREREGDRDAHDVFYFHVVDGTRLYHIQTAHGDGTIEDWSAKSGMNVDVPWGYKPIPGVPFEVSLAATTILGGAMLGDEYHLGQLERLREYADAGEPEARLVYQVAKALRKHGFDPRPREFERTPAGIWHWATP